MGNRHTKKSQNIMNLQQKLIHLLKQDIKDYVDTIQNLQIEIENVSKIMSNTSSQFYNDVQNLKSANLARVQN